MAVLLRSEDLASVILSLRDKKLTKEEATDKIVLMIDPLAGSVVQHFPLYMKDDLKQDLSLYMSTKVDQLCKGYLSGEISGSLVKWCEVVLRNRANDLSRKQHNIDSKMVRIDDVNLELMVYPKTYEKSKVIKKIRKAIEAFFRQRYGEKHAEKASRFAHVMLQGKRPSFDSNVLEKFFGGRRGQAQQAYSTVLVIIRRILEQHKEEITCFLDES